MLGGTDEATRHLAEANDGWEPRNAFERADADLVTAGIQLDLGQLDTAEQFATSAMRSYGEGHYRRGSTLAELLLAQFFPLSLRLDLFLLSGQSVPGCGIGRNPRRG